MRRKMRLAPNRPSPQAQPLSRSSWTSPRTRLIRPASPKLPRRLHRHLRPVQRATFCLQDGPCLAQTHQWSERPTFRRELRPINDHPMMSSWDGILTDVAPATTLPCHTRDRHDNYLCRRSNQVGHEKVFQDTAQFYCTTTPSRSYRLNNETAQHHDRSQVLSKAFTLLSLKDTNESSVFDKSTGRGTATSLANYAVEQAYAFTTINPSLMQMHVRCSAAYAALYDFTTPSVSHSLLLSVVNLFYTDSNHASLWFILAIPRPSNKHIWNHCSSTPRGDIGSTLGQSWTRELVCTSISLSTASSNDILLILRQEHSMCRMRLSSLKSKSPSPPTSFPAAAPLCSQYANPAVIRRSHLHYPPLPNEEQVQLLLPLYRSEV